MSTRTTSKPRTRSTTPPASPARQAARSGGQSAPKAPPLKVVRVQHAEVMYSPYSGRPVYGARGPNSKDPTLLLVHTGNAGMYGYISPRLRGGRDEDAFERTGPAALCRRSGIANIILLEVDMGWNGIDTYAFAPAA